MKQRMFFVMLFSAILSLLLAGCSISSIFQPPTPTTLPPRPVIGSEAVDKLNAKLAQMTQNGTFSGSVLIAQDGKILLSEGYGLADRAQGIPNTPQTRFHLGSTTKPFTAMGILILQSQGKLSVQDPICNFFEDCPQEWQDITIHHLLTHSSGLSAQLSDQLYQAIEVGPSGPVTLAEEAHYLGLTSQWPLDSPPGERQAHNNFGYILLVHIIVLRRVFAVLLCMYERDGSFNDYRTRLRRSDFSRAAQEELAEYGSRGRQMVAPDED